MLSIKYNSLIESVPVEHTFYFLTLEINSYFQETFWKLLVFHYKMLNPKKKRYLMFYCVGENESKAFPIHVLPV